MILAGALGEGTETKFNHMAKDSFKDVYVMKPQRAPWPLKPG